MPKDAKDYAFWEHSPIRTEGYGAISPQPISGTPLTGSELEAAKQMFMGTELRPDLMAGAQLSLSPRDRLLTIHEKMSAAALGLMKRKNVDYASREDPFRNFRSFGLLGVVVRLSDKIARLHSLVERGLDQNVVKDETYLDTLLDIINYAVIFGAMAEEGKK